MATHNRSSAQFRDVEALLDQIAHHGTPFRIDSASETYYVLSADQLMTLLHGMIEDIDAITPFTPQAFGLTEAELSAYEARRQARREHSDPAMLTPLEPALEQRLRQWNQGESPQSRSDQQQAYEQLLHELETVMGCNVQAVAKKTH